MADPEGRAGGGEGGLGAVPQQGCREHSPPPRSCSINAFRVMVKAFS